MTYVDTPDPAMAGKALPPMNFTFVDSEDPAAARSIQYGTRTIDRIGSMMIAQVTHELANNDTAIAVSIMQLPSRMRVRSARSPSIRLRAPIIMDLPAPVSPVIALQPRWSSSVRSLTRARFLMRRVTNIAKSMNLFYRQSFARTAGHKNVSWRPGDSWRN